MNELMRFVAAVLTVGVMMTGCAASEGARDGAGMTEEESLSKPLEEQYALAGERYDALYERVTAMQQDIYGGEWRTKTSAGVIPGSGFDLGGKLVGDTRDNSYYYTSFRNYVYDDSTHVTLEVVRQMWAKRGWDVTEDPMAPANTRLTVTAPDGYWYEARDWNKGEFKLAVHSPVYWGSVRKTNDAIRERLDAENAGRAHGDTFDPDEDGNVTLLPGVYRPFPAWDALEKYPSVAE
ncbi:hypothetical protein FB468_0054 [Leucobacter komagatae]|uniref:Lipoprotein n=1 Tax=Leucobacter komagatae TaxID=55969 RepID=A0A542Y1X2_9MICO|nr:hypothetical protein [Leucobacter komagatae]TQL42074.1 hypothetical protein FB468_0054 [Leucobacter komagatae]